VKLIRIEQEYIQTTFPLVEHLLQKAINLNRGEFNLEDVYNWLLSGYMHLWIGVTEEDGIVLAATSEFCQYPRKKSLKMPLVAAEKNTIGKWLDYCWRDDSEIIAFAKENNADTIESTGRKGWNKVLANFNFKEYYTVLIREIN